MNVSIIDNNDALLIINGDAAVLTELVNKKLLTRFYSVAPTELLGRCSLDNLAAVKNELETHPQTKWNMVVVRFSSGSTYLSTDPTDQEKGRNITG